MMHQMFYLAFKIRQNDTWIWTCLAVKDKVLTLYLANL